MKPTASTKKWPRERHDFYVEPRWCSRVLFKRVSFNKKIIDPACGMGSIIDEARNAGHRAFGTDIVKRVKLARECDFLDAMKWDRVTHNFRDQCDHNHDRLELRHDCFDIVCNPPFGIAQDFVVRALSIDLCRKVAMLLPVGWVASQKRSDWLRATPFEGLYVLTPRPSMPPGDVVMRGMKADSGTTDFAWYVWDKSSHSTILNPPRPGLSWLSRNEVEA